jgi:hypothetical protein
MLYLLGRGYQPIETLTPNEVWTVIERNLA